MSQEKDKAIPGQKKGIKTDTVSSVEFETLEQAIEHFNLVRSRLLNVSSWEKYSGEGLANFTLFDEQGQESEQEARAGFFFRIDIPGPGTEAGSGYDWVRVEAVEEEGAPSEGEQRLAIRVRPSASPLEPNEDTAHFFNDYATSTFIARREHLKVSAEVHGRNEQPNTQSETLKDTVRNVMVGVGAILGFSKVQWKALTDGLVKE